MILNFFAMKTITILVPQFVNLGSIDNPRRAFLAANQFLMQSGKEAAFKVQLCSHLKEVSAGNGAFTIRPDITPKDIRKTDIIIVPAFDGNPDQFLEANKELIPWLIKMRSKGAELASLCVGACLLAASGQLDGKTCSTHWRIANIFMRKFPEVLLNTDRVITDENGIYTSGGAFTSANLILYLIEKFAGREVAVYCSKIFQIEMDRNSQSPFIIFDGQKGHNDIQVKAAQEFIEKNYSKKISVTELTKLLSLSRRSLERRFKSATSNTITEYIHRVKIEAAKKHFEASNMNINEVMYEVGYLDNKAFRSVFRNITGLTPFEYRNRYNFGLTRA